MTRLSTYLQSQIDARGINVPEFSKRADLGYSHVYQILRGTRKDPGSETLRKIASGLGMSLVELQTAIEGEPAEDPIQEAIARRVPALREAVREVHERYWKDVVDTAFDGAIDEVRRWGELLPKSRKMK